MNIKESFEHVGFTPEEKTDLTARLMQAAEQEENMTDATKRKIKRISGGMMFGIAAAAIMTAGALAAVISPGLRTWFDTTTPGAPSALEDGIYRLDRSQTYNGWTVTLGDCVGDDNSVYIWADLTAPEGTVLAPREGGGFQTRAWVGFDGAMGDCKTHWLADTDPTDNRTSFVIGSTQSGESPRGQTAAVTLGPITDYWTDPVVTSESENDGWYEDSGIMAAIRDHEWVFEDVKLDFPDQTIRLTPNTEIPYLDGTATLTQLDISPLSVYARLEGGSCAARVEHRELGKTLDPDAPIPEGMTVPEGAPDSGDENVIVITTPDGETVTSGDGPKTLMDLWLREESEMSNALTMQLTLKDGTGLGLRWSTSGQGYMEGVEGPQTPYVQCRTQYDTGHNGFYTVLNPAQVDHVIICGVDIPVDPAASVPLSQFAQTKALQPAAPDSTDAPEAPAPVVGTVNAGKGLNVRSGPGPRFEVVGGLRKGTQITILGEENGFYQVDYSNGKTGYVSKNYVSVK